MKKLVFTLSLALSAMVFRTENDWFLFQTAEPM